MSSPQETSESKINHKSRRRGPPMLGILLVALGTLLLLHTTDVLPWTVWFVLWQFWPVLLIVAGVICSSAIAPRGSLEHWWH